MEWLIPLIIVVAIVALFVIGIYNGLRRPPQSGRRSTSPRSRSSSSAATT